MRSAFTRRLLGTTLPVAMPEPYGPCNANAATQAPQRSGAEILADVREAMEALGPKPRWAGGGMPGIRFEVDPDMPDGWFGLREPGAALPYAGPLPLSQFGVFYRGGDVVRLSPGAARELQARAASSDQRGS